MTRDCPALWSKSHKPVVFIIIIWAQIMSSQDTADLLPRNVHKNAMLPPWGTHFNSQFLINGRLDYHKICTGYSWWKLAPIGIKNSPTLNFCPCSHLRDICVLSMVTTDQVTGCYTSKPKGCATLQVHCLPHVMSRCLACNSELRQSDYPATTSKTAVLRQSWHPNSHVTVASGVFLAWTSRQST